MGALASSRRVRARHTLSHLDARGRARMVDVTAKAVTLRTARARAVLTAAPTTVRALRRGRVPKGNAIEVARLAGIQAVKWTAHLIPLCHPLHVTFANVEVTIQTERRVVLTATVSAEERTGVEMEALTAVSVAALALYDMVKAIDRSLTIARIELIEKQGGKSGAWLRRAPARSRRARVGVSS